MCIPVVTPYNNGSYLMRTHPVLFKFPTNTKTTARRWKFENELSSRPPLCRPSRTARFCRNAGRIVLFNREPVDGSRVLRDRRRTRIRENVSAIVERETRKNRAGSSSTNKSAGKSSAVSKRQLRNCRQRNATGTVYRPNFVRTYHTANHRRNTERVSSVGFVVLRRRRLFRRRRNRSVRTRRVRLGRVVRQFVYGER